MELMQLLSPGRCSTESGGTGRVVDAVAGWQNLRRSPGSAGFTRTAAPRPKPTCVDATHFNPGASRVRLHYHERWMLAGPQRRVDSELAAATAFANARPMFNGRFTPLSIGILRESTRYPS
jgi:hypothetical protein